MRAERQDLCRQHIQYLYYMTVRLADMKLKWRGLDSGFERRLQDLIVQVLVLGASMEAVLPDADGQEGQP